METEVAAIQHYLDMGIEFIVKYGFQVLSAIIILVIGLMVARKLAAIVSGLLAKRDMDVTLASFIGNITKIVVLGFVIIIAIGKFGISIAPFIAAIGALAFGSSLALQGPLSNYGAGLTIIMSRPFVIGDTLTVKGVSGVVEDIALAHTQLTTEDGEKITIPNKHIVGEILVNSFQHKIVEATVGISYGDDPEKAIETIQQALSKISQIPSDPAPQIGIEQFGDSSVNIGIRYWVPTNQYFQLMYQANNIILKDLKSAQINIPFPQREVRMLAEA
jgi:small conductance mechanosensitive channel